MTTTDRNTMPAASARIVMVTGSLLGGGAERILAEMASYFAKQGVQVSLATWSGPDTADFYSPGPGVRRVWLNVPARHASPVGKLRSHLMRVRKLRDLLKKTEPDVVLSFLDWSNVLTIAATIGLRTRTVVSERVHVAHYSRLALPWKMLRRLLYSRADAVVAQTDDVAHWLRRHFRSTTYTIPNPLRSLPVLTAEREPYILAVGRLSPQKGFDLLLRAFARLQQDFPDWNVLIVGAGPEREALIQLADRLEISTRVSISDPVKDVESLMARAGLVVQPSRFEGFPNVVLESMGMGAAVISADCPSGPSELIENGVNGFLVPVDDVDALAQAMVTCLSSPELREQMGKRSVDVRERFRQDKVMQQWEACLLPDPRSSRPS